MDAESIELQLESEVRSARGHDRFTGNSALDLVMFIKTGAQEMVATGRTSEDDLEEAKANLHRFLDEMESGRVELGYTEYREDVVEWARSKLCPMWPFCTTA
jgi:hypothetical protein